MTCCHDARGLVSQTNARSLLGQDQGLTRVVTPQNAHASSPAQNDAGGFIWQVHEMVELASFSL